MRYLISTLLVVLSGCGQMGPLTLDSRPADEQAIDVAPTEGEGERDLTDKNKAEQ